MSHDLFALSPLDGRYQSKVSVLSDYFSEAALMRYRLLVEVEWFIFLFNTAKLKGTRKLNKTEVTQLRDLVQYFDGVAARRVKDIEKVTNHDVKAIEYYIKENVKGSSLEPFEEFFHFGCTSEDINNLSYALMLKHGMEREVIPALSGVIQDLEGKAKKWKSVPMLSRTHGQSASPTTVGKELLNVVIRLKRQLGALEEIRYMGKINGAVGNFNAHSVAYPKTDWMSLSEKFLKGLNLEPNMYTTQIEPHDFVAELCDALKRMNTVILDLDRDMWSYISRGYFKQKLKEGEVGSSTMPHKVNPIDFENSEGNLGLANAMLTHFSEKLPLSRMQRDLTDSTVFRNVGSGLGYSLLGYRSVIRGLQKVEINKDILAADLDSNWEVLAEPIQMVMRRYGIEKPYEKLKALTRGKRLTKKKCQAFIDKLEIPAADKRRLKALTPGKYIGNAVDLVNSYFK